MTMTTRATRGTVAAAALLAAVAAGCGSSPTPAPPATPAPTPAPAPSTATPAPTPADRIDGDVAACSDGTCRIEVRDSVDVPLTAFGIRLWRIEPDAPGSIHYEVRPGDVPVQVNGGNGGEDGGSPDARAGSVVVDRGGSVITRGITMSLVQSDGRRAVVQFSRS